MEDKIIEFLNKYNFKWDGVEDEQSIQKIYDFYFNETYDKDLGICINHVMDNNPTAIEMLYYAIYYHIKRLHVDQYEKENIKIIFYDNMVKYYLMAIENGNLNAAYYLATYYEANGNNQMMIKYYLMAVIEGNSEAMYRLGYYYERLKDHILKEGTSPPGHHESYSEACEKMIKYYLMAAKKGHTLAKFDLNVYLIYNDNTEHLLRCRKHLNTENRHKLNKLLKFHIELNKLNVDELIKVKECSECREKNKVLEFECKHFVCYKCYDTVDKCPVCFIDVKN